MFLCNREKKEEYSSSGDLIQNLMKDALNKEEKFASHKWLAETLEKRIIYWHIYNDLLIAANQESKKVLDIGGGFCSLTRKMLQNHDYSLVDIMAHDDATLLREIEKETQNNFWVGSDWNKFETTENYDIIIANDLFPNVDQRLELFLNKYLPKCSELRLSLTYYNNERSYTVKRIDADEIFNILAWDNIRLIRSLEKYKHRIKDYNTDTLLIDQDSIFSNGRQVCIVTLRGDLEAK